MQLLIGADMVPTKSNEDLFIHNSATQLVGEELLHMVWYKKS